MLNIDTAWHTNYCYLESKALCLSQNDPWDKHGAVKGYGGMLEWDRNLFPYAPGSSTTSTGANKTAENPIVTWLRDRSLSSYLDVHQCPGIWPENTNYIRFAKAMGMTDKAIADKENIRVLVENRTFNREFFNRFVVVFVLCTVVQG